MGFDEWAANRAKTEESERSRREARDAQRYANATQIVEALATELRTVIPHLRDFPSSMLQEQHLSVGHYVSGRTVGTLEDDASYPEGQLWSIRTPLGVPRQAWEFPLTWLDEDGHLWLPASVSISSSHYRRGDHGSMHPQTVGLGETVLVPFHGRGLDRWLRATDAMAEISGPALVSIDGARVLTNRPVHTDDGMTLHVTNSAPYRRKPAFFPTDGGPRGLVSLHGASAVPAATVGFYKSDDEPTILRDHIFETVQAAVRQGLRTL